VRIFGELQLFHIIGQKVIAQLVTCLILSRPDYCNSVLVNLAASTTAALQRVQNTAVHLILITAVL